MLWIVNQKYAELTKSMLAAAPELPNATAPQDTTKQLPSLGNLIVSVQK